MNQDILAMEYPEESTAKSIQTFLREHGEETAMESAHTALDKLLKKTRKDLGVAESSADDESLEVDWGQSANKEEWLKAKQNGV